MDGAWGCLQKRRDPASHWGSSFHQHFDVTPLVEQEIGVDLVGVVRA
jgi:hypothetical protein